MQTQQQFPICVVRSFFRFTSFATYFVRISLRNYNTTKTVDSFPFRKGRERETKRFLVRDHYNETNRMYEMVGHSKYDESASKQLNSLEI